MGLSMQAQLLFCSFGFGGDGVWMIGFVACLGGGGWMEVGGYGLWIGWTTDGRYFRLSVNVTAAARCLHVADCFVGIMLEMTRLHIALATSAAAIAAGTGSVSGGKRQPWENAIYGQSKY